VLWRAARSLNSLFQVALHLPSYSLCTLPSTLPSSPARIHVCAGSFLAWSLTYRGTSLTRHRPTLVCRPVRKDDLCTSSGVGGREGAERLVLWRAARNLARSDMEVPASQRPPIKPRISPIKPRVKPPIKPRIKPRRARISGAETFAATQL